MPLGMSKHFVICTIVCILIAYGTKNWKNFLVFFGLYIGTTLVWRYLTRDK